MTFSSKHELVLFASASAFSLRMNESCLMFWMKFISRWQSCIGELYLEIIWYFSWWKLFVYFSSVEMNSLIMWNGISDVTSIWPFSSLYVSFLCSMISFVVYRNFFLLFIFFFLFLRVCSDFFVVLLRFHCGGLIVLYKSLFGKKRDFGFMSPSFRTCHFRAVVRFSNPGVIDCLSIIRSSFLNLQIPEHPTI